MSILTSSDHFDIVNNCLNSLPILIIFQKRDSTSICNDCLNFHRNRGFIFILEVRIEN